MDNQVAETKTAPPPVPDTHSYRGWMNSDSFLKRAFGVWGHMLAAQFMAGLAIAVICIVFGLLFGFAFSR